ncbi:hypothetical protein NSP_23890 [Nodularia spumigena CCY9414]|nr:hypothetical protein NSP_23890 [Nodularia spumigena CCY9414]
MGEFFKYFVENCICFHDYELLNIPTFYLPTCSPLPISHSPLPTPHSPFPNLLQK